MPRRITRIRLALALALVSALAASATATAAPTAPPPVTILTPGSRPRRHLHLAVRRSRRPTPTARRSSTSRATSSGSTRSRRAGGVRLPHPDLPGQAGADLVAGHRPRWPGQRDRLHLQRPLPADRDRPGGERLQRGRPRVPDHPVEHRADPGLHDGDRRPDLDRRPREPDSDQRHRPGDRHPRPARCCSSGTAPTTCPTASPSSRCPRRPSTPWDWFHINAVHLDTDGNLLIDARDTWTTYKVTATPGKIVWQLGGKASTFTIKAAPGQVAGQCERALRLAARPGGARPRHLHVLRQRVGRRGQQRPGRDSRVRTEPHRRLQARTRARPRRWSTRTTSPRDCRPLPRATRRRRPTVTCSSAGAPALLLGVRPVGQLLFNAEFPAGVNTYRAYLLPWNPSAGGRKGHASRVRHPRHSPHDRRGQG